MDEEITRGELVQKLAPCGLDCSRCASYTAGSVRRLAEELSLALRGYERVAAKLSDRVPAMAAYADFAEVLAHFASASCHGCRAGGMSLSFCAARTCHQKMGVDFCFECSQYPCDRNQYPEALHGQWRAANDQMRDIGAERYYRKSLERPRY